MIMTIASTDRLHLLSSIIRQYSRDALSQAERSAAISFNYIQIEKIDVNRRNRALIPALRNIPFTKVCEVFNSRSNMYDEPCTNPCYSHRDCHTCPMIAENRSHQYFEALNLQTLTSNTCRSKGIYSLVHKHEPKAYWGGTQGVLCRRMNYRWASPRHSKRFGPRKNWNVYAFGTSGIQVFDLIIEDAFILLFTGRSNHNHLNTTINILDIFFRRKMLIALENVSTIRFSIYL